MKGGQERALRSEVQGLSNDGLADALHVYLDARTHGDKQTYWGRFLMEEAAVRLRTAS